MTRYKYIILFVLCMMLFPNITKAECSYERQAELSRIASNVQISYNYEKEENSGPVYTVNITNLFNDIYIKDEDDNIYIGTNEVNVNYIFGGVYSYNIYSNDSNCKDEFLLTQYVSLPYYNMFSSYDECKKYPELDICSLWGGAKAETQNDFYNKIKEYENSLNSDEYISKEESDDISNNTVYVIMLICGIITLSLLLILKKKV